jgi:hypothetical protein
MQAPRQRDLQWFSSLHDDIREGRIRAPEFRRAHLLFDKLQDTPPTRRAECTGLTDEIKRVFYSNALNVCTGGARTGGAARGSEVDRELAQIINEGLAPPDLNAYTVKVLEYLAERRYKPFLCQALVKCPDIGILTRLDILCVDMNVANYARRSNLVNIQLKTTGTRESFEVGLSYMTSPVLSSTHVERLRDSYLDRALVQCVIEHYIVQETYAYDRGQPLARTIVLGVFSNREQAEEFAFRPRFSFEAIADIIDEIKRRDEITPLAVELRNTQKRYARAAVLSASKKYARIVKRKPTTKKKKQ